MKFEQFFSRKVKVDEFRWMVCSIFDNWSLQIASPASNTGAGMKWDSSSVDQRGIVSLEQEEEGPRRSGAPRRWMLSWNWKSLPAIIAATWPRTAMPPKCLARFSFPRDRSPAGFSPAPSGRGCLSDPRGQHGGAQPWQRASADWRVFATGRMPARAGWRGNRRQHPAGPDVRPVRHSARDRPTRQEPQRAGDGHRQASEYQWHLEVRLRARSPTAIGCLVPAGVIHFPKDGRGTVPGAEPGPSGRRGRDRTGAVRPRGAPVRDWPGLSGTPGPARACSGRWPDLAAPLVVGPRRVGTTVATSTRGPGSGPNVRGNPAPPAR